MTFRNYLLVQAFGAAAFDTAMNVGYTSLLWRGETYLSRDTGPASIPLRAVLTAIVCAVVFAPPLSFLLPMAGDGVLTLSGAIGTKVAITIVFSLAIVPLVVYATTRDVMLATWPVS